MCLGLNLINKIYICDLDSTRVLGFGLDEQKIPTQHEDNNQNS
jgi:hypothetical protein